jgi:hypothetical protein
MTADKEESKRRHDALFRVLDKFGLPPLYSPWIRFSVHSIVKMVVTGHLTEIRAIKPSQERKRLRRIRGLAQKLARELREMNPAVLHDIENACLIVTALPRLKGASWARGREVTEEYICPPLDRDFWTSFWETVGRLDRVIDQIAPEVNRHIDVAPDAGRRDLMNIEVIRRLLPLWEDALNKGPAPLSITDAGELSEFLAESFDALGLQGNCRAAMDSLREYVLRNPDGWFD